MTVKSAKSLLPLAPGTTWHMAAITLSTKNTADRQHIQKIDVQVANTLPPGLPSDGHLVISSKDGQVWRRELYRASESTLELVAAAEEDRPFMTYAPAITLAKYPVAEGQSQSWNGRFLFRGHSYPATAFSRVSAIEPVPTGLGKRQSFRIDTMITVDMDGNQFKFPTVRWLAPGIGFTRRAFVEQGDGVYAELQRFQQPGSATSTL